MKQTFTIAYKKQSKLYVGWIDEIPGVNTQGRTLSELKENLIDALNLVLETNRMLGDEKGSNIKRELITLSR